MKKQYIDIWLVGTIFILMILGIIMVYSSSAFYAGEYWGGHLYFLKRHLSWLFLGLIAMAIAYSFPFHKLKEYTWIFVVLSGIMLFYCAFINTGRWIYIGPIHFQAVDVAKCSLIIFFADSLSRKEKILSNYNEGLFPHLFYLAAFSGMVLMQPDFSSSAMLVVIGLTMLFVAPVRVSQLVLTGLAFIPPMIVAVMLSPYKMQRVFAFMNPEADLQGDGYQVYQSLVSLGSGGVIGKGFAKSTQKMFFLPEAHTDFIFAIIGEEWGLLGTLFVVSLFVVLMVRGIKIARRAPDRFTYYMTMGVTANFVFYAVVNMMVTLRLLPATGLPMPFVSYGGTALLFSCFYAGMLLRFANLAHAKGAKSSSRQKDPTMFKVDIDRLNMGRSGTGKAKRRGR